MCKPQRSIWEEPEEKYKNRASSAFKRRECFWLGDQERLVEGGDIWDEERKGYKDTSNSWKSINKEIAAGKLRPWNRTAHDTIFRYRRWGYSNLGTCYGEFVGTITEDLKYKDVGFVADLVLKKSHWTFWHDSRSKYAWENHPVEEEWKRNKAGPERR